MRRLEKLTTILIFGPGATIQNGLFAKLPDQKISFLRPFLLSVFLHGSIEGTDIIFMVLGASIFSVNLSSLKITGMGPI